MKKFLTVLTLVLAFCINGLAQKKASVDPCLSKDPKVRATSKKPCPSAPVKKTTKPPESDGDDDSTTDDSEDSDETPANDKPTKKPNPPTKGKTTKNSEGDGSMFFITIEHNGEKTEIAYTQYETYGGQAMLENEKSNRLTFFYGASNSVKNDEDFMFMGMIARPEKGSYPFGKDVTFSFKSDKFPNVPIFGCEAGSYEIEAVPLKGGFVVGSFTAQQCSGEMREDGTSEKYSMSGRFKLMRMM